MLEIPGEEAPTDPGIHARQRKDVEDKATHAKKQRKNRILGALSLLALFALGGAGVWVYDAQQEALTYEMDDFYSTPLSELEAAAPLPAPALPDGSETAGKSVAASAGRTTARRPADMAPIGTGSVDSGSGPARPTFQTGADASGPDLTSASRGMGGSVGIGGIKVGFVASDKVLTDNDEIFAMTKAVINASSPQLTGCYNQRLKSVEGLKGAWEVSFTIAKDGTSKNIRVNGVSRGDEELERCMERQVSTWKFQKIVKDQPVRKTYRFGASSW